MTLDLYITRRFFAAVVKVQVILLGVILMFDFVDLLARFGGPAGTRGVLALMLIRVPGIAATLFPLVVLIASLWTWMALARSSELVVIRAAGLSGIRLAAGPMALSLIFGLFAFGVVNPIVAATSQREDRMMERYGAAGPARLSISGPNIWLRQAVPGGQMVIEAGRADPDGRTLHEVLLFRFAGNGTLATRTEAASARLDDGAWVFSGARSLDVTGEAPGIGAATTLRVETEGEGASLEVLTAPEQVPFWQLLPFTRMIEAAGFSGVRHRLFFQSELARPVVYLAMLMIGMAFAMRPVRFGNTAVLVLAAILAGFAFYFVTDVAQSFAGARQMPVWVAVWAPPAAVMMLALALILHLEEG
jgi:lipopolysaccharide export system permease protein